MNCLMRTSFRFTAIPQNIKSAVTSMKGSIFPGGKSRGLSFVKFCDIIFEKLVKIF